MKETKLKSSLTKTEESKVKSVKVSLVTQGDMSHNL